MYFMKKMVGMKNGFDRFILLVYVLSMGGEL